MKSVVLVKVCSSHVAVKADSVRFLLVRGLNHVEAVSDHVGMLGPPRQRLELLHGDETTQIVDLSLGVVTIRGEAREVEELGTIVHFLPEALLHSLLCLAQVLVELVVVEMGQDSHHVGHSVVVQQTKELKCLHLEADGGVDQEQGQVHNFGHIDHRLHIRGTLHKRDSLVFVCPQGDGASHGRHFLLREVMHQGLDQGGLATIA